jgi:S-phase kinase-associated protein 1
VAFANVSATIRSIIEDAGVADPVPIHNVAAVTLAKVVEYCAYHADASRSDAEKDAWKAEFVKMDQHALFDLILAANYLNIQPLLDLGCETVARAIAGKSPEEVRATLNITNDFTPEEEEELKRDGKWAFE